VIQDLFGGLPSAPPPRERPAPARTAQAGPSWFFALRPAAEDAARIHASAGRLLAAHGIAGKRRAPELLHVSLDEVGEYLEPACRAADTIRLPALEVRFDAAATFGGSGNPFVLVGTQGLRAVHELRLALGCALADQGFKVPRAYEPHMTLCYEGQRVQRTPIEPIAFRATEFALVKSHVGFSRHEVLRTWPLAG
jgi:2'-5' RNA ligase